MLNLATSSTLQSTRTLPHTCAQLTNIFSASHLRYEPSKITTLWGKPCAGDRAAGAGEGKVTKMKELADGAEEICDLGISVLSERRTIKRHIV